jgi:hypothetical protein
MDRLPAHNRVSIRAVLVRDGEDPGPALAAAGIVDPVAVPVVAGDHPDLSGGILGDGVTANLTATLETEQGEDAQVAADGEQAIAGRGPRAAQPPATTTLPPAYGMQPLAPVRRGG